MYYEGAYSREELISLPDACEFLGVSITTLYKLLREKQIKGFKIGSKWKVSKRALEDYIRERSGYICK